MNAVWQLFENGHWLTFARKPVAKEASRADEQEKTAGKFTVTEEVWNSAVYLGPGGPMMRDR